MSGTEAENAHDDDDIPTWTDVVAALDGCDGAMVEGVRGCEDGEPRRRPECQEG